FHAVRLARVQAIVRMGEQEADISRRQRGVVVQAETHAGALAEWRIQARRVPRLRVGDRLRVPQPAVIALAKDVRQHLSAKCAQRQTGKIDRRRAGGIARDLREAGRSGFAAIAGIILAAAFITTVTAIAGVAFAFTFVAAAVLVAGIADAILIGVGLVRVGDKGTVVHVIGDVIAIDVVVAGIAEII